MLLIRILILIFFQNIYSNKFEENILFFNEFKDLKVLLHKLPNDDLKNTILENLDQTINIFESKKNIELNVLQNSRKENDLNKDTINKYLQKLNLYETQLKFYKQNNDNKQKEIERLKKRSFLQKSSYVAIVLASIVVTYCISRFYYDLYLT